MAASNAVWGIDIGQCALKALKLRPAADGKLEAVAFDVIEHAKILSQPDADRDELISSALEKLASRHEWQNDSFVIGVPGQQTFARFCKMPPIDLKKDAKKIHDLVRYEASQQIPFDMEDVVWDYQVFASEGSPDIEVGIFAIRKDLIRKHLGFFSAVGIAPTAVQAIPAALYNFCTFDGQATTEPGKASVLIDVGSQNTDLIIIEPRAAWTRNIPLGGNSFTEALVRAFKLSFAKAESLKRSAATSKYARQIFQAMRPVFAELVAEIQRSLGFYSSTHRDVELREVLAVGNAFHLPGLQKYLENNLTVGGGVRKLEKFAKLIPSATINAPQFTENLLSFGAAYGLALQGLGLARIHASLLPAEMARIAVWGQKRPYFIAAAAALALAAGVPWIANALDMQKLTSDSSQALRQKTQSILQEARGLKKRFGEASTDTASRENDVQNLLKLQQQKLIVPRLFALVLESLPPPNPPDLAEAKSGAALKAKIQSDPKKYSRTLRGQLLIESLDVQYADNVEGVSLSSGGGSGSPPPGGGVAPPGAAHGGPMGGGDAGATPTKDPGFVVRIEGRLLYGTIRSEVSRWLEDYFGNLRKKLTETGLGFYLPADDPKDRSRRFISEPTIRSYFEQGGGKVLPAVPVAGAPAGTPGQTARTVDPVTEEDAQSDWRVSFTFKVRLGDMPPAPPEVKK